MTVTRVAVRALHMSMGCGGSRTCPCGGWSRGPRCPRSPQQFHCRWPTSGTSGSFTRRGRHALLFAMGKNCCGRCPSRPSSSICGTSVDHRCCCPAWLGWGVILVVRKLLTGHRSAAMRCHAGGESDGGADAPGSRRGVRVAACNGHHLIIPHRRCVRAKDTLPAVIALQQQAAVAHVARL